MKKYLIFLIYLEICSGLNLLGKESEWEKINEYSSEICFYDLKPNILVIPKECMSEKLGKSIPPMELFPKEIYNLFCKAIRKEALNDDILHVKGILRSEQLLKNNVYVYFVNILGSIDHNSSFVIAFDLKRNKYQRFGRWEVEEKKETNGYYVEDLHFIEKSLLEKKDATPEQILNILISYIVIRSKGRIDYVLYSEYTKKMFVDELLSRGIVEYENFTNSIDIPKCKKEGQGNLLLKFSLYNINGRGDLLIHNYKFMIINGIMIFGYPVTSIMFTKK